ncbi:MAG TPA: nuclease-related domain-containing protein [Solirubrobacteraceae bacterium]|nr:nuclease-related domain-containing protein [Solirubrobacteraceae bacterium]
MLVLDDAEARLARRDGAHGTRRDATRRTAGQHARAAVTRLRLRTLVTLGVLAVATAALGRIFGLHDLRFLFAELALLASMFVISRYVLPLLARRDRGARAEEHVGSLLEELDTEEWRVIHDASLGHGNVDHILVGPAGVFTVETKSHPGPVRVGRVHGATIRQAQAQRDAIERVVETRVEPLLVFSRAWVDRPGARRKGVRVLPARMLTGYLAKRAKTLSRDDVAGARERLETALREQQRRDRLARSRRIIPR